MLCRKRGWADADHRVLSVCPVRFLRLPDAWWRAGMRDCSTERSEGPAPSAGLLGRKERAVAAPAFWVVPRPGDGGWCLPGWPPVLGVRWVGGHSWRALPVLGAAAGGCGGCRWPWPAGQVRLSQWG